MGIFDGYPLCVQIIALCVFTPIFVAGAIGNLLVIGVVLRNRQMQNATNIFISQLAVGDLLIVLFCMPFTVPTIYITGEWIFGSVVCKVVMLLQTVGIFISGITLVAMSIERYLVLLHPMQARAVWTKSFALKICGMIYLVSCLLSLPRILFGGMIDIAVDEETGQLVEVSDMKNDTQYHISTQCMEDIPSDFTTYYYFFRVVFLYVMPVIIMATLYYKIAQHLRHTTVNASLSNKKVANGREKVVRMLAAMVLVFAVCWLPPNTYFVLIALPNGRDYSVNSTWFSWYFFFSGVLVYFSCISNPILYTFMSSQYRRCFRKALCCFQIRMKGMHKSTADTDTSESKPTRSDLNFTSSTVPCEPELMIKPEK